MSANTAVKICEMELSEMRSEMSSDMSETEIRERQRNVMRIVYFSYVVAIIASFSIICILFGIIYHLQIPPAYTVGRSSNTSVHP
jgi:hypothetical protein